MNGLKLGMLLYSDRTQYWLDSGHRLLIFLIWAQNRGPVEGLLTFYGEYMGGITCNLACTLTAFKTLVYWFSSFWCNYDFLRWFKFVVVRHMKGVKFGILLYTDNQSDFDHSLLIFLILVPFWLSVHFLGNVFSQWSESWYADVSWPPLELIIFWLWSVHFPNLGTCNFDFK